jgi:hypothetical protein
MYQGYSIDLYPVRPGAREFLEALANDGYKIIILTAADIEDVWEFLEINDLKQFVHDVTNKKVPAIIYIDDRAIRFDGDFSKTLSEVREFVPHWEHGDHNNLG